MSFYEVQARRLEQARQRRLRRRLATIGAVVIVAVAAAAIAVASSGGGSGHGTTSAKPTAQRSGSGAQAARSGTQTSTASATGVPGTASVPILMYHVINSPPSGAPFPGLYVSPSEFADQMRALKGAGWHAVTLDQLRAYWTHGAPLGPGKPIVLTFDNGYQSQYTNALPVLRQLGWKAVENIQLTGLPPSQGGLTEDQVRGLLSAGWELDTQGMSHADLIKLSSAGLHEEIAAARQILRQRYRVAVNWFCYPSGHYNAMVIAAVRQAGFVGSTTVMPGWAGPHQDPFRLPRLRVLGGTSPSALLAQIADAQRDASPPPSYSGAGTA